MDPQYVVPYTLSNAIAVLVLVAAFLWPKVARWAIAVIFAYASVYNTWLGLNKPDEYQGFADLAWLDFYRDFIRGYFRENAGVLLPLIGLGQGVIAVTMVVGRRVLWVGVLGTCVFLLAIAPLGVGSAFPFSIIVSIAAVIVWRKSNNV